VEQQVLQQVRGESVERQVRRLPRDRDREQGRGKLSKDRLKTSPRARTKARVLALVLVDRAVVARMGIALRSPLYAGRGRSGLFVADLRSRLLL
jgi:hypothetical protein